MKSKYKEAVLLIQGRVPLYQIPFIGIWGIRHMYILIRSYSITLVGHKLICKCRLSQDNKIWKTCVRKAASDSPQPKCFFASIRFGTLKRFLKEIVTLSDSGAWMEQTPWRILITRCSKKLGIFLRLYHQYIFLHTIQ